MGTKASKATAVLRALISEKASIFKGYNGLMLVDSTNSNIVFIIAHIFCTEQGDYILNSD